MQNKTTEKQVTVLGKTFSSDEERRAYFREELRKKLPELKQMEGFPIGEDDDIIKLSDPPYYTACPNPWLNDFINEWEGYKSILLKEGKRSSSFDVKEPFASDVNEGKYDPFYKYHSYPTKVPHKAIIKFINHYTQEGDSVFDGFSGTGMTGLACQSSNLSLKENRVIANRNVILSDLSPLASFLSFNYNSPINRDDFSKISKEILHEVKKEIGWMFETKHLGNVKGKINYVLWSDVFICPNCSNDMVFWNDGVDQEKGKVRDFITCSNCGSKSSKSNLERAFSSSFDIDLGVVRRMAKQVPVLINYKVGSKRYEKKPDLEDLKLIDKINSFKIDSWIPTDRMPEGGETRRNDPSGVTNIHDFYSRRNLVALSLIKRQVNDSKLNILITKVAYQITKLYRYTYMSGTWGAGGGPLSGTLYIPSLIKELNIVNQIDSAIKQSSKLDSIQRYGNYVGSTGSTTGISNLGDNSIDYIFTDPPFGANLNYSELAVFSEAWLKVVTNNSFEAIQNKAQNKSLNDYKFLISKCFQEYFRVLKTGGWISVVFSNTKAEVWNSINTAIQNAGFIISNVSSLDKKKGSFKVVTTPTAVKQDLIISCYKPSEAFQKKFNGFEDKSIGVWEFIEEHMYHLPIHLIRDNATTALIERRSSNSVRSLSCFLCSEEPSCSN